MLNFTEIQTRVNGNCTTFNVDGYTTKKTILGAVHEIGKFISEIEEEEGTILTSIKTEKEAKEALIRNTSADSYCFELEEVSCASMYDEEADEILYAEGKYYFHIRFFVWDEEKEKEKNAVLGKLNNFLAFVKNNELLNTKRKIDQGYGFSQGLIAVYDELFDDIAEITQNWISSFYNTATEPETEEPEEEPEEEETETEQPESLTESEREEIAARMNEEFAAYGVKDGYIVLPDQVTESARYRVDSFQNGKHIKEVFQNPTVARWTANDRKKTGFHVFLLKEVVDNLYEVIEEF